MTAAPRSAPGTRLRQLDADTVAVEPADPRDGPEPPGRLLIEARCPHRGGLLRHAHVNAAATRLVCPLHRSTFDLTDHGAQLSGPPCRALRVRPVSEDVPGPASRLEDGPGDAAAHDG